jgi:hypothetical protein
MGHGLIVPDARDEVEGYPGFRARVAGAYGGERRPAGGGDLSIRRKEMRKLALLATIVAAGFAATAALAAGPEHVMIPVQDSFYAPFMSDACGIPVTITIEGVSHTTLWRNEAGLVVRERDVLSSFTATFESRTALGGTGRSFTNRSPGVAEFDYGSGAVLGSTSTITLTGNAGPAAGPGTERTAGYQRLTGTVVDFSPAGIPIVDFDGPVLEQHGRWPVFDVILAQRCAELGGTFQP